MTIGNELDQAFYNLGQRLTKLENKSGTYYIEEIEANIERIEAELNDRIDEQENFDPDDLRCDLESRIEEVADNWSYMDDRLDDIDCYKITEDEARDIAIDVVREEITGCISDYVEAEINNNLDDLDLVTLQLRVAELEARLNKPSLGARVLRWLREGPSIREVATGWYASIRRGS